MEFGLLRKAVCLYNSKGYKSLLKKIFADNLNILLTCSHSVAKNLAQPLLKVKKLKPFIIGQSSYLLKNIKFYTLIDLRGNRGSEKKSFFQTFGFLTDCTSKPKQKRLGVPFFSTQQHDHQSISQEPSRKRQLYRPY